MELKVKALYQLQRELDQRIFDLHQVTREGTRQQRLLALLIELGECANETRCFKYWSLKGPAEKAVILEEYGDGIHFLLSLGIDLDDQKEVMVSTSETSDLTESFLKTFAAVHQLTADFTLENYYRVFAAYLNVADLLGFSADDVETYYLLKNKKNHQRQDEGY